MPLSNSGEIKNKGFFHKLDIAIRTARAAGTPEGFTSPSEFAARVMANLVIAPQDIKDIPHIPAAIKAMVTEIKKDPAGAVKYLAENPPHPATVAAMVAPTLGLKAYRNLVPLSARTYIHGFVGGGTPFTQITNKERTLLKDLAQENIDNRLQTVYNRTLLNAVRANKRVNILLAPDSEIEKMWERYLFYKPGIDNEAKRRIFLKRVEKRHGILFSGYTNEERNARKDFIEASGGVEPKGYYSRISEMASPMHERVTNALGKHYVEPMITPEGKVVPKSIQDVYKFYPEHYGYDEKVSILGKLKQLYQGFPELFDPQIYETMPNKHIERLKYLYSNLKDTAAYNTGGEIYRRLAFKNKPYIINLNLQDDINQLNTIDKAAILAGLQSAAKEK